MVFSSCFSAIYYPSKENMMGIKTNPGSLSGTVGVPQ
jgi:hypothetical protein